MTKDYILVTGGAGFIGSNFVLQILSSTQLTVINLEKVTCTGSDLQQDRIATETA